MLRPETLEDRAAQVWRALDDVLDPELDAPVTDMGFVERVAIEGDAVAVDFRLPTFWCSANFAFLMAVDMRLAVERLSWTSQATVRLLDHFAAKKINSGAAEGRSFGAVFADEATGTLDDIRKIFQERAFLGRQERLLRSLVARQGIEAALATTLEDLRALTRDPDPELRQSALRYLALRQQREDDQPAFTTLAGEPVTAAGYVDHLHAIRRVRGAAEANAELCRMLLEARRSHPVGGWAERDSETNPH